MKSKITLKNFFKTRRFTVQNLLLAGLSVITVMSLVGCGSELSAATQTAPSQYSCNYISNDETVKCESAATDLNITADIKASPEYVPEVTAKTFDFDEKTIVNAFLDEGMRTEFYSANSPQYSDKNGLTLNFSNNGFDLFNDYAIHLDSCLHLAERDEAYNADKFSQTTDFKFMPREDALNTVIAKLEECGLSLGDYTYTCYCLDYKTLKKYEYVMDKYGNTDKSRYKDNWSEEDNCYYFCIRQAFNNIPEYHLWSGLYRNYENYDCSIQAIVSKDGIIKFDIDSIPIFTNTGKQIKILTPQQILDKIVAEKLYVPYKDDKNATYTIESMNLCYFSDFADTKIIKTIPVYQCHIKETYKENNQQNHRIIQLIINAETGDEQNVTDIVYQ